MSLPHVLESLVSYGEARASLQNRHLDRNGDVSSMKKLPKSNL